jgi:hypothetical protein
MERADAQRRDKDMDWLAYTIAIFSHLACAYTVINFIQLWNHPLRKYARVTLTIPISFFIPWVLTVGFWMWFFVG